MKLTNGQSNKLIRARQAAEAKTKDEFQILYIPLSRNREKLVLKVNGTTTCIGNYYKILGYLEGWLR